MSECRMLCFFTLFILLFALGSAYAQAVPDSFTYQGKLVDTLGNPLLGSVNMTFKLYESQTGGTAYWSKSIPAVALVTGLFSVQLGPPPAMDLKKSEVWLEVQVQGDPPLPRVRIYSAPYALRSGDLALPFIRTVSDTGPSFGITNEGTGDAGNFKITNSANNASGIYVEHSGAGTGVLSHCLGNGSAGFFQISNSSNTVPALKAETSGTGDACNFKITNSSNNSSGIYIENWGMGNALLSQVRGTGRAGYFQVANSSNTSAALCATTNGSGSAIQALAGTGLAGDFQGILQTTAFKIPTSAATGRVLTSDSAGNATWQSPSVGGSGTDNYVPLWNGAHSLDSSVIFQNLSGYVGIATTNPTRTLTVNGDIGYTGSLGAISDLRFKTNIKPLANALLLVDRLRPVTFQWKRDEYPDKQLSPDAQIGFVAQEVREVVPEVVSQGSDGYYMVDYGKLTPVLIQAVKEQQNRISDLESRIARLEKLLEMRDEESGGAK